MGDFAKYQDVEMLFTWYYKYSFHFEGRAKDGTTLRARIGGDHDNIYRFEVTAGVPYKLCHGVDGREFQDITIVSGASR